MKRFLFLPLIAMVMVACSPFTLKSSGALNGSDMTSYKSFKFQKIDKDKLPKNISGNDLVRLYQALANELTARGYEFVKGDGAADLTMHVGLSTKQSVETNVNTTGIVDGFGGVGGVGVHGGPGRYGGYNYYGATPYVNGYLATSNATSELVTDGILIVDLVDNSNNNHVFYSQISANLDCEQLIIKDNEKLAKAAAKVFKKFPVEPNK